MKCFEHIIKAHIKSSLSVTVDPLQFTYRPNRSTDDAVALALHTALSYLDQKKNVFVDAVYPPQLRFQHYDSVQTCHETPGSLHQCLLMQLDPGLPDWQTTERIGNVASSPLTLCTGVPQGCLLSPLLYTMFTHDFMANIIIKFAEDIITIG